MADQLQALEFKLDASAKDRPLVKGQTAFDRELMGWLNAERLSQIVFPETLHVQRLVNYVDVRLSLPRVWRDVYINRANCQNTGWTRMQPGLKEPAFFTPDGKLVVQRDDLGRCHKARNVVYSFVNQERSGGSLSPALGSRGSTNWNTRAATRTTAAARLARPRTRCRARAAEACGSSRAIPHSSSSNSKRWPKPNKIRTWRAIGSNRSPKAAKEPNRSAATNSSSVWLGAGARPVFSRMRVKASASQGNCRRCSRAFCRACHQRANQRSAQAPGNGRDHKTDQPPNAAAAFAKDSRAGPPRSEPGRPLVGAVFEHAVAERGPERVQHAVADPIDDDLPAIERGVQVWRRVEQDPIVAIANGRRHKTLAPSLSSAVETNDERDRLLPIPSRVKTVRNPARNS